MGWFSKLIGNDKVQEDIYLMQDEIENLNTKVYESLALLGECLSELDDIKKKITKSSDRIESKIKSIPKEMVVRNVLDI